MPDGATVVVLHLGKYSRYVADERKFTKIGDAEAAEFVGKFMDAVVSSYVRDGILDPIKDAAVIRRLRTQELPNPRTSQDALVAVLAADPDRSPISSRDF